MSPSSMRCEPKPNLSNALSKFRALTRLIAFLILIVCALRRQKAGYRRNIMRRRAII